ncbi:MAG: hypothetical protein ACI4I2_02875 [Oscillospiraceae bacterium]
MNFLDLFRKNKKDEQKKKTDLSKLSDGVSLAANSDILTRYSDAGKELQVGLTGVDNSTGQVMQKSLIGISEYKINPEWKDNNIKQQAGFSAEVLDTAKRNAEAAKNGDSIRYTRVDDITGRAVNETAFDVTAIDMTSGLEVENAAAQMKFIKSSPEELAKQLTGKDFSQKYPHGKYMVAKDDYSKVMECLNDQEQQLMVKYDNAASKGNVEVADKIADQLEYTQKVKANLKPSVVTREEAIFARNHPNLTIAKETIKSGHQVGKQCALVSGGVSGALSLVTNVNKYLSGEISSNEAIENIGKDVVVASGKGYIIGQANTALGAVLKNSSKEILRKLGQSNAPAYIISMTTAVLGVLKKRADGKITDAECIDEIARSGVGLAGSATGGAAVGLFFGPAGAIIGSLIGGVVVDKMYVYACEQLKAPYYAKEERMLIEQQCRELHEELENFRSQFEATYVSHTQELRQIFGDCFRGMAEALEVNNPDVFIASANRITTSLGGNTQFSTVKEFSDFLDSGEPLDL